VCHRRMKDSPRKLPKAASGLTAACRKSALMLLLKSWGGHPSSRTLMNSADCRSGLSSPPNEFLAPHGASCSAAAESSRVISKTSRSEIDSLLHAFAPCPPHEASTATRYRDKCAWHWTSDRDASTCKAIEESRCDQRSSASLRTFCEVDLMCQATFCESSSARCGMREVRDRD
jgi:hypothetical protein